LTYLSYEGIELEAGLPHPLLCGTEHPTAKPLLFFSSTKHHKERERERESAGN
jgi:hypothetical protein